MSFVALNPKPQVYINGQDLQLTSLAIAQKQKIARSNAGYIYA